MAILRSKDIRKLDSGEIRKRLSELNIELAKERANISVGASVVSPGRIREIKRTIARIKTIQTAGKKATVVNKAAKQKTGKEGIGSGERKGKVKTADRPLAKKAKSAKSGA